jgi:hypothetical protein
MYSLSEALEFFNRKERNLLVRDILGERGPLHLSDCFCNRLTQKLGFPINPKDTWWATDYHISWLAGALALFVKGEERARDAYENKQKDGRQLVEGNQEDVDLVIATGNNLVLIEAKAYGAWSKTQLDHKLARLELLDDFYKTLIGCGPSEHAVKFHFLLTSPAPPSVKPTARRPSWAFTGQEVPWTKLEIDERKFVFKVTRCDARGKKDAKGGSWHIEEISRSEQYASVDRYGAS